MFLFAARLRNRLIRKLRCDTVEWFATMGSPRRKQVGGSTLHILFAITQLSTRALEFALFEARARREKYSDKCPSARLSNCKSNVSAIHQVAAMNYGERRTTSRETIRER